MALWGWKWKTGGFGSCRAPHGHVCTSGRCGSKSRSTPLVVPAICVMLASAPVARGQETGPCSAVEALEQMVDEIERARDGSGLDPSSSGIVQRLDGLDRDALDYLRLVDPFNSASGVAATLREYAEVKDRKGTDAARKLTETEWYLNDVDGLRDLKEQLRCEAEAPELSKNSATRSDLSEGGTFIGSRRPDEAYGFGHVSPKAFAIGVPVFLLLLAAGTLIGLRIARNMRRRKRRYSCNVVVHVEGSTVPEDGTMLNVSQMGAKIICPYPPKPGAKIRLQWNRNWHEATVIWSNSHCAGMRFHKPIDARTLKTIRRLTDNHLAEMEVGEAASPRTRNTKAV